MSEPLAYLNGELMPASQAALPLTDSGFMQGVTVAEQVRTFRGELFRLDDHLRRLFRSLDIVGVESPLAMNDLAETARRLVEINHALLDDGDDLGLSIFVTPGIYPTFREEAADDGATLGMHTYRLPFDQFADVYKTGQSLITSSISQVPLACWPAELKCRSRMHYYLADREAREAEPGARALLLDTDGLVAESSTANIVIYRNDEGLLSPPREKILPGISLSVMIELAGKLNIPFTHRELTPEDVATADEAILTSTSSCLLPAVRLDGNPIGTGQPGAIFRQLLSAWSELVNLDIADQAKRFARRPS